MKINIDWHMGERPQFNVEFYSTQAEPFMTIRGCRIVDGSKGPFVSWPASKNEKTGKWWNHVMCSEAFNAEILRLARADAPAAPPPPRPRAPAAPSRPSKPAPDLVDDDSDVPF